MHKYYFILLTLIISSCCKDQIEECPCFSEQQTPIYKGCDQDFVYDMYNGCSVIGLYNQIYSVIKYPQEAIADSVQGTVAVSFDIFENGSMGNYSAINDTLGQGLAEAAIAAVKTLNNKGFCPARENCEPIIYNFTLPVTFKLH